MPRKGKKGGGRSNKSQKGHKGGQKTTIEYGYDWFSDMGMIGGEDRGNKKRR